MARTKQENEFLAKKLKEKTRALDEELTSRELKFDDLEFDESDGGILGEGAFGIVKRATFLGEVSLVDLSAKPITRLQHHCRLTSILRNSPNSPGGGGQAGQERCFFL